MTTLAGTAAAARQAATGFALRAQPSAACRALKDLHHFLGHERAQSCWVALPKRSATGGRRRAESLWFQAAGGPAAQISFQRLARGRRRGFAAARRAAATGAADGRSPSWASMINPTNYYDDHADEFFDSTVGVDMAPIRDRLVEGLAEGAQILDAGCGSGRDAKAFAAQGFQVTAFDASAKLAELASAHCGFKVHVRRFEDVNEVGVYDGIWCCASLLHVAAAELPGVIAQLWNALRPGGRIYLSFKRGIGERLHGGMHFTDADEEVVRAWLGQLPGVDRIDTWTTQDRRPDRIEFWTNAIAWRTRPQDRRLITGAEDHFLPHLQDALSRSNQADLAVAFVKSTGLRMLMPDLRSLVEAAPTNRLRVLTSDYLDITDPEALRLLLLLQEAGAEVRVYTTQDSSFHLKAYIFAKLEEGRLVAGTAFIGSSNISRQALQEGLEWNYRVVFPGDSGYLEARTCFEQLFNHPQTVQLTYGWIEAYERRRLPPSRAVAPGSHEHEPPPEPSPIQRDAMKALCDTRDDGYRRGLVVMATGLGKTWLAAFDAHALGARRILFVAHREEILGQAAATFIRILPEKRVGFYSGASRDADVDVLCASIQTLGKAKHLQRFAPGHDHRMGLPAGRYVRPCRGGVTPCRAGATKRDTIVSLNVSRFKPTLSPLDSSAPTDQPVRA